MDNSMDVDDVDFQVKNENEEVSNLNASGNTEQPEQPIDEDEFGDDDMVDIDEEDIKQLMSPQPTKTMSYSTPTQSSSTNLNFSSSQNSVMSPKPRSYVTSITSSQSTNPRLINLEPEEREFYNNLKKYYNYLFPTKKYYNWLSYGNVDTKYFPNREFSFTLHPEVYLRFQSFDNEKEFKEKLLEYNPKKIDIGAVYNNKPKAKKHVNVFKPVEKELVFDIDMTDYDDIRTCCTGGSVCRKCWTFMTISIKIIDRALRDDFGFKKILWVYSGRRGVHCWVCDERARKLSESARKAIVGYLEVVKGGEQQSRKVKLPRVLHPSLEYAKNIVNQYFPKLILDDMGILNDHSQYEKILAIIPESEKDIYKELEKKWENSMKSPQDKWQELVDITNSRERELDKKNKYERLKEFENFSRDVMFQYTYPRLDFNVSLRLNHLLKSPFCIHPGTGNVCVPIDPANCDDFDPTSVPTLNELCKEIDEYKKQTNELSPSDLQKNTSIAPYIKQFSDFVKSLDDEISRMRNIKRDLNEQNLEF